MNKSMLFGDVFVDFSTPKIMGILNITADSFFVDSRLRSDKDLLKVAERYLSEGATFLDIGAMSSRPGAIVLDEMIEITRIRSAIDVLKKEFPDVLISVDTFRSSVAQCAIDHGANMINDISGFAFDDALLDVVASQKVAYVLMHIEGTFATMHSMGQKIVDRSEKNAIVERVDAYFSKKLTFLRQKGVENVVLDPGFGFSKTVADNHKLLHELLQFQHFQRPILVGVSRKSMIYKILGTTPEKALNGTSVLHTVAIMNGANILRVHDVGACREVIQLLSFLKTSN